MKPTIRHIAKELAISPATVSKALAGKPEVNEMTRARILACAREMGYVQNGKSAQDLKRVAILIEEDPRETHDGIGNDSDNNLFYYDMLIGFKQYASRKNFEVLLQTITRVSQQERILYDEFLLSKNIEGVFCYGLRTTDPYFAQLETTTVPTVIVDYSVNNKRVGRIGVDNTVGVAMAMDHLISLGHRKIGFLNGHSRSHAFRERFSGYASALCRNGLTFDQELVFEGDWTEPSGRRGADYFAKKNITAICCAGDLMAIGVIHRLIEKGIRVPKDISVVGFDNLPMSAYCTPRLTTVAQDRKQIGITACAQLHALMAGDPLNHCVLRPTLVVRDSTCRVS
jgi:DNA-binding LacI/PurR family transcriptional regulator